MPYPEFNMEDPDIEKGEPRIQPPDLDNLDDWLNELQEKRLTTPFVSFSHLPEDEQWKNTKVQLKMFAEGQRALGLPDKEIIKYLMNFVNPEPTTSKRT